MTAEGQRHIAGETGLGLINAGDLEAAAFNLDPKEPMFAIEARVFDNADRPLYFQNIFAPCERCMLEF